MWRCLLLFFCMGALAVSCSKGPEKKKCISDTDCNGGECFQGFCGPGSGKCRLGETKSCYSGDPATKGKGGCREGVVRCLADGSWSTTCEGETGPQPEVCNGVDDDCDGKVDNPKDGDALKRSCYTGPDGSQGKGPCKEGQQTCKSGKWSNCEGEVKPATEICGNQKDDDCNGQVDDVADIGKPCINPAASPECRNGTYVCKDGKKDCQTKAGGTETCDGKDNDCDGAVDEDCPCKVGDTRPCGGSDKGACKKGTQKCVNGKFASQCVGAIGPKPEVCNGIDDNCDGRIDNRPGSPQPLFKTCYTGPAGTKGVGPCKEGRSVCVKGKYTAECSGQVLPEPELCENQIDDNCDGLVDNVRDLGAACLDNKRKGRCRGGILRCWGEQRICLAQAPFYKSPIKEECNGIDDDCDGFVDNNTKGKKDVLSQDCGSDKGLCQKGKKQCVNGRWSDVCVGGIAPAPEACNQKDDDCDGQTDEGGVCSACTSGQVRNCFNGPISARNIGRCREGTEQCALSKWTGKCVGAVLPRTEDCNGLDDDCDGRIDNQRGTKIALQKSCYTGKADTRGKGNCSDGVQICKGGKWESCKFESIPKSEICDGKDNNCDGKVDEGSVCFQTARKLFESCVRDKNKPQSYEKCGAGLVCLQTNPASPESFCYQTCTDDSSCGSNKDGRTSCLIESVTKSKICLALAPSGAPCDEEAGVLCESGAICDMVAKRCRPPSVAPALGACGGETRMVCPSDHACTYLTPGLPNGYCLKKCSARSPCPTGIFCFLTSPTEGVCLPEGKQKKDQLCGNPTGDRILANEYCEKKLFCFRPSNSNPLGVCVPWLSQCRCASDRVCFPAPGNTCLSLKKCGTCPGGQVCAKFAAGNACAPSTPTGTVPFGGECTLLKRCLPGLLCFTKPGAQKGHCAKVPCKSDTDCPKIPAGAKCQVVTPNLDKACVFPCTQDSDCQTNFVCDQNLKLCFPK